MSDDLEWGQPERGWMQTFTGRRFYPLAPRAADIDLRDIAHGLAMTCRYGGHSQRFYSVAEHCMHVAIEVLKRAPTAWLVGMDVKAPYPEAAREALLHDSAEAYIGDMVRPLKHQPQMLEFRRAEVEIEIEVFTRFGIKSTVETAALVKEVDDRILVDEITQLMSDPSMYLRNPQMRGLEPLGVTILGLDPGQAERQFLRSAEALGIR